MTSKLTVNSLRDQLHNYCAVRQLYQGDSVSLSLEQARDLLTDALGIAVDIEAVSPAAESLGTTDATLPPLPWDDIEAWLEVRDTKEVAADIRAYGEACATAEREACIRAVTTEMEKWRGECSVIDFRLSIAAIRARKDTE